MAMTIMLPIGRTTHSQTVRHHPSKSRVHPFNPISLSAGPTLSKRRFSPNFRPWPFPISAAEIPGGGVLRNVCGGACPWRFGERCGKAMEKLC